ncbi:MAG: DUF4474 domain-containing protein, partial [Bacilli bacterium]|nr:DUF4474 domain-containing protein [Bacilli bacterium]
DTLPIRFYYNNSHWLITFWKGQYGMTTGAEIGIYKTKDKYVTKNTLYFPVMDDDMLDMRYILYKGNDVLLKAQDKHWWLAVFKMGEFSWPHKLSMAINITFPNKEMLHAFLEAFEKLGYKNNDYRVIDTTFYFFYRKPRGRKVWSRFWLHDIVAQASNKHFVRLYQKYLIDFIDDNQVDDSILPSDSLLFVHDILPEVVQNQDSWVDKS